MLGISVLAYTSDPASWRCSRGRSSVSSSVMLVAIESGFVEIEKRESVFVIDRLVSIGDARFGHVLAFAGWFVFSYPEMSGSFSFSVISGSGSFSLSVSGLFSTVDLSISGSGLLMSSQGRPISTMAGSQLGCRLWDGRSLRWPDRLVSVGGPDRNLVSRKADHCDGRISGHGELEWRTRGRQCSFSMYQSVAEACIRSHCTYSILFFVLSRSRSLSLIVVLFTVHDADHCLWGFFSLVVYFDPLIVELLLLFIHGCCTLGRLKV